MSTKLHHYVYLIIDNETLLRYIGSRSCNIKPIYDIGKKYFSTSTDKLFIKRQKSRKHSFTYKVLSEHLTRDEALLEEGRLHELYDVDISPDYINKTKQNSAGFDASGKVAVKDIHGNGYHVACDDPRYLSGELVPFAKGKAVVRSKNGGKCFTVDKDDPRIKSGKFESPNKNMISAIDQLGNTYYVSYDDPRFTSGELVGCNMGRIGARDKNGKRYSVFPNDERLATGELIKHIKQPVKLINLLTNEFVYIERHAEIPENHYLYNNLIKDFYPVYEYKNLYYFTYDDLPVELHFSLRKSLDIVDIVIPDTNSFLYRNKYNRLHADRIKMIENNGGKTLGEIGLKAYDLLDINFKFDLVRCSFGIRRCGRISYNIK